jgi:hypothetical protein
MFHAWRQLEMLELVILKENVQILQEQRWVYVLEALGFVVCVSIEYYNYFEKRRKCFKSNWF